MTWNYYTDKHLQGLGVSCHNQDLRDLVKDKRQQSPIAYCTSKQCAKGSVRKPKPYVDRAIKSCPDCSHALLWRKSPKNRIQGK